MAKYGMPYQGSKSRIAEWVVDILPPSHTLVDLFAGGCAIGDDHVSGIPYAEMMSEAQEYISSIGGFEALAEWGLIRPEVDDG